jgi:Excreted virulence factor EspC, type VII ESX diderm
MTTDRLGVRHADLVTHAGHVENIAGKVTTAAEAGSTVRAGGEAYGKLCVMVPVMLNALQDVLIDGINAAAESLQDTGARLRTTATEYETTDQQRATTFKTIGDGM